MLSYDNDRVKVSMLRKLHSDKYVLYDKVTYELLFIVVVQPFIQKQQK